ncbi:ERF superfamily protein [Fusobacterium nucleatum]|uniref:ERF family protein n=1 Tax=Fusobacterium nucleatum TaxID=851 RepID=UPI00195BB815|nr:ERF family protein [Fusobacterium nucleatum]VTX57266.1 ERF superfamily protein [Fusobacterium nucleatum]
MNIYEKLLKAQVELKAPKGQYNSFGKYKYRSCEDILEALKPVLDKFKLTLFISDEIVEVGGSYKLEKKDETVETIGRKYVKATITLVNIEKPDEIIKTSALAREEETKKGMDGSQITGASSSYARKYALNGMFMIDDTKDSDSTNTHGKEEKTEAERKKEAIEAINKLADTEEKTEKVFDMIAKFNKNSLLDCTPEELKKVYTEIKKKEI